MTSVIESYFYYFNWAHCLITSDFCEGLRDTDKLSSLLTVVAEREDKFGVRTNNDPLGTSNDNRHYAYHIYLLIYSISINGI